MSIYDKKYQIFISSTYLDLVQAREEVIKVILSLYQIPIGMEMFSADNSEQWDIIKTTIESSDYYILIVGHRYGSETKDKISYTEKEFDYAKSLNIPIIAFVRKRDIATKPIERDDNITKTKKLQSFLDKVIDNAMCDFWENESELAQKVAVALTKQFFKSPRIGWTRADRNSLETTEELTKLIQENRELREDNQRLKSINLSEIPELIISFNDNSLNLHHSSTYDRFLKKISIDDIPEEYKNDISNIQLEEFNNSVDKFQNEIISYHDGMNIYQNIKNNAKELVINISNIGSRKANDVHIDIKFPPEIIILEKDDIDDAKLPKKPKIVENPINRVMNLKNEIMNDVLGLNLLKHNTYLPTIKPKVFRNIRINRNNWVDKEENSILIKLENLLQTRNVNIKDDLFIVAKKKGTFDVLVNVICDEYKTSDIQIITLNVE